MVGERSVESAAQERQPYFVQSFARGLSVIGAFGEGAEALTLSEVAARTDMTRATARRFLLTLVDLGYVRTDGRVFRLTPKVLALGYAYLSSLPLTQIAEPHLENLVSRTRESSSMSVLDGTDVVYVARVPTVRIMAVAVNVGTRFPAYVTSMGRVLLAALEPDELDEHLAAVRLERFTDRTVASLDELRAKIAEAGEQGYAVVDQELEAGLRSLAAPVHDRRGKVVAAVNVSTHASRVSLERAEQELLPALLETVAAIEADLVRVTSSGGA